MALVDDEIQEPIEDNPDPAESTEDESLETQDEDQVEEEETSDEPSYYTIEEMKALNPEDVDTSRIPPEQLPFYKSMQKGWGNKFQELADLKKEIREEKDTTDQIPEAKPQNIFEAYVADQKTVTAHIDGEIKKSRDDGDDNRVEELKELKDSLRDYKVGYLEKQSQSKAYMVEAKAEINRHIPDFSSKVDELSDFVLDLVPDVKGGKKFLQLLTHPGATVKLGSTEVPMPAVWFSRIIDAMHSKTKATKKPRKTPSNPISPGSGHTVSTTSIDLDAELKKATANGTPDGWARYMGLKRKVLAAKKK